MSFGKREMPPPLPRYECWSPLLGRLHNAILRAPDSFQARLAFAREHIGMEVVDVCARRLREA